MEETVELKEKVVALEHVKFLLNPSNTYFETVFAVGTYEKEITQKTAYKEVCKTVYEYIMERKHI